MRKLWLSRLGALACATLPQAGLADGIAQGLADPPVVATSRTPAAPTGRYAIPDILPGSNQVGRPGVAPDQIGGYDVNIAYDHVAVGLAIVGVLFLMTEWMDVR